MSDDKTNPLRIDYATAIPGKVLLFFSGSATRERDTLEKAANYHLNPLAGDEVKDEIVLKDNQAASYLPDLNGVVLKDTRIKAGDRLQVRVEKPEASFFVQVQSTGLIVEKEGLPAPDAGSEARSGQLNALRQRVNELSTSMNHRFDQIDQVLGGISARTQQQVDGRLRESGVLELPRQVAGLENAVAGIGRAIPGLVEESKAHGGQIGLLEKTDVAVAAQIDTLIDHDQDLATAIAATRVEIATGGRVNLEFLTYLNTAKEALEQVPRVDWDAWNDANQGRAIKEELRVRWQMVLGRLEQARQALQDLDIRAQIELLQKDIRSQVAWINVKTRLQNERTNVEKQTAAAKEVISSRMAAIDRMWRR
jgi:hypothetical protein